MNSQMPEGRMKEGLWVTGTGRGGHRWCKRVPASEVTWIVSTLWPDGGPSVVPDYLCHQCVKMPHFLHSCQHWVLSIFQFITYLKRVKYVVVTFAFLLLVSLNIFSNVCWPLEFLLL